MKKILPSLTVIACALFAHASAQTPDRWIYTDSLETPWIDDSEASVNYSSTQHVYSGAKSIGIVENGWEEVQFRSGPWGQALDIDPDDYSRLEFALYSTTPALAIAICVANDDGGLSDGVTIESLPSGQWILVSIPMGLINPEGITINTIGIYNPSPRDGMAFSIDAVRLVGQPSAGTPSSPTQLSPESNATGVSNWPTLSWLSSSGATSYKVQVSTDSSFSSLVFQDSTISLTLVRIPGLSDNTSYYWRVRAKNSYGTSAYSSTRRFTIGSPNTVNEEIYQDDLLGEWTTVPSYGVTLTVHSTTHVYSGTYSLKVHANAWGVLVFRDGDWGPIAELHPSDFDSLAFEIYSEKSGVELVISVCDDEFDLVGNSSLIPSVANQWIHVAIPMSELDSKGVAIRNVYFASEYNKSFNYYLDQVRFVAHPQAPPAQGPPAPLLALPPNSGSNQSLLTMLKWHSSDSSAIDYQLEVATDSSFASLVFNDSTIVDTTRMMTLLEPSVTYYWRVNARDSVARGSWSEKWHFLTRPDTVPVLFATAIDPTIATIPAIANKFLYTGANKVQFGVDTSALNPVRFATVRGLVLRSDNAPLPGVKVSVLDHPEFGYTFTRSDGIFDMAVNGGGALNVVFMRDGYPSAQRQIQVSWQEYVAIDTVVMVTLDTNVTRIDLSQPSQVASGTLVSDTDGERRARLIFEEGTAATMTLSDGTTQGLNTISVRATEYTVGENGIKAMPAELPATSAYTYCVELSVDEATVAGAQKVSYSKPVALYVENFLEMPVGTRIPLGWFDRTRGVWTPENDGLTVKIMDTSGGIAQIDLDGDNIADDTTHLRQAGITPSEQVELASMYSPGESLWRSGIESFSPHDCNFPPQMPPDARAGTQDKARTRDPKTDKPDTDCGSIIGVEGQTLGESVAITGTPFSLFYQSSRVPGYSSVIDIPVTDATIPSNLSRIEAGIAVAGKRFDYSIGLTPNRDLTFIWDGKDVYGRTVQGRQPVEINLEYVYPFGYAFPDAFIPAIVRTFSLSGTGEQIVIGRRPEGSIFARSRVYAGHMNATIDGWEVDAHHVYDPQGRTVMFGNGGERAASFVGRVVSEVLRGSDFSCLSLARQGGTGKAELRLTGILDSVVSYPEHLAVGPAGELYFVDNSLTTVKCRLPSGQIERIAGTGEWGYNGDSILATDARFSRILGLDLGQDGSVYLIDNSRVRRIDPQGIVTTIAGTGEWGFSGDGGPATEATFEEPVSIAVAPDGSVYVCDWESRIRRIMTDGRIYTVAGTGESGYSGDGGPARVAQLYHPLGITVDKRGIVYFADNGSLVRRIDQAGNVSTVAGTVEAGYSGDGGPATSAQLNDPSEVRINDSGIMCILDRDNYVIRAVSPEGIISTVVGTGESAFADNGLPAIATRLASVMSIWPGPDQRLYFIDSYPAPEEYGACTGSRIRCADFNMPGFTLFETTVASEDGLLIYVFDAQGKHTKTLDALTGVKVLGFSYDSVGHLSTIADRESLVTTLSYDGLGRIQSITSPFGQATTVTADTGGFIRSIIRPDGDSTSFTYYPGGLLNSMKDPRGNLTFFAYDSVGRLIQESDPAGGYKTFAGTVERWGSLTTTNSVLGRTMRYELRPQASGGLLRTSTDPAGLVTTTLTKDGFERTLTPDGTTTATYLKPDPRFGMTAPLVDSMVITTPGGLHSRIRQSRTITALTGLEVTGISDTMNINGRIFISEYDGTQGLFKQISPEGRVSFSYTDSFGRVVKDSVPGIAAVSYSYDSLGFLRTASQASRTTSFEYDHRGRLQSVTDPTNRTVGMYYDSVGRVTRQVLADEREILYSYDANGNMTSLTPPGKPSHAFQYTSVDLTHKYSPPDVLPDTLWDTNYLYDLDRQLTQTLLPDGDSVVVKYDTAGCGCSKARPREIVFDRGALVFTYDSTTGNLARIVAPGNDTLSYTYDGSLPLSTRWSGSVNGAVSLEYDNDMRVVQQKVTAGGIADSIAYTYDNDGLLKSAGALRLRYEPSNGLFLGDTLGNIVTNVGYNTVGEMSSYEAKYGENTLFSSGYQRDSLGRITTLTETIQGETTVHRYAYDLTGGLENVWRNDTLQATYYYDTNGNRDSVVTPSGTTRGTYDAQDRMLTYGNARYFYTKRGSLSMKVEGADTTQYHYDLFGNLTKVVLPNGDTIEDLIDAQNRRVGRKLNGRLVSRWVYSGQLTPIAEMDSSGVLTSRFVFASHVNVPDYIIKGDTVYRVVTDHLGSVRLVVNQATGAIVHAMSYDAWGNVLEDTNPGFMPFGFAGGQYDEESELVRFGFRDYMPASGTWMSKDILGFAGGTSNLFEYSYSNPINRVDFTGTQSVVIPIMPPDVDLGQNIRQAEGHRLVPVVPIEPPSPLSLILPVGMPERAAMWDALQLYWYFEKVKNCGPWDYKRKSTPANNYEPFGNFNYGATAAAMGIPDEVIRRAAGAYGEYFGFYDQAYGHWYGRFPFGDQEVDQYWIGQGINYYHSMHGGNK